MVALTGKESESSWLKKLGAKDILLRSSLNLEKIKPLDKSTWAGAIDNLGADVLAVGVLVTCLGPRPGARPARPPRRASLRWHAGVDGRARLGRDATGHPAGNPRTPSPLCRPHTPTSPAPAGAPRPGL